MAEPSSSTTIKKEEETLKCVLSELGETSTLHGVPKIISSQQMAVKVLWCLLLLGTTCVFFVQLYELCDEYYSYPSRTTVKMKFEPIPFPDITFCNMNPIKRKAMKQFPWLRWLQFHSNRLIDSTDEHEYFKTIFLDDIQLLSKENRTEYGHQLKDLVLTASFPGHNISFQSFSPVLSYQYGNCFTLNTNDIIARGSGKENSLALLFNIEKMDYIESFSSSYGVRLVLHQHGTYPLPGLEGITLGVNYETHIGMRKKSIRRLGGKYGKCTYGQELKDKYGLDYSVPLCYSVCEIENVISECHCRPLSSFDVLNIAKPTCKGQHDCLNDVEDKIFNGTIQCSCDSRCEETIFTTTLSGRKWPHRSYLLNVLLKESCIRNTTFPVNICEIIANGDYLHITGEQYEEMSEYFLAVYVYFEDLNFEEVSEEPMYNTVRFMSDIGGAMGLYIGASVLTCVEVLQLVLEVLLFYRRKWMRPVQVINPES